MIWFVCVYGANGGLDLPPIHEKISMSKIDFRPFGTKKWDVEFSTFFGTLPLTECIWKLEPLLKSIAANCVFNSILGYHM